MTHRTTERGRYRQSKRNTQSHTVRKRMKKWGHSIQELVLLYAFSLEKLLCSRWLFLTMTMYEKSLLQSRIYQYSTFWSQYLHFAYTRVNFWGSLCVRVHILPSLLFICSDNTANCCAYFVFDFDFDTLSMKRSGFFVSSLVLLLITSFYAQIFFLRLFFSFYFVLFSFTPTNCTHSVSFFLALL